MIAKVGIVGGLGSGKSYISNIFRFKYNIPIYNSDERAKTLMVNDRELRKEIIKNFGTDSFTSNGNINKQKFNTLLFNNSKLLSLMNSLVVPFIEKDFNVFCENLRAPYVLKESAIMFETGTYKSLDKIICIVSDMDTRKKRVMKRDGMSSDLFLSKVNIQSTDEEKIKKSDFVIYNNNKDLEEQVEKIHIYLLNYHEYYLGKKNI